MIFSQYYSVYVTKCKNQYKGKMFTLSIITSSSSYMFPKNMKDNTKNMIRDENNLSFTSLDPFKQN